MMRLVVLFFLIICFVPLRFPCQGFNEATKNIQMIHLKRNFINLPKYFSRFREAGDNEINQSYLKENQGMNTFHSRERIEG